MGRRPLGGSKMGVRLLAGPMMERSAKESKVWGQALMEAATVLGL